jgi:hypothetical protein
VLWPVVLAAASCPVMDRCCSAVACSRHCVAGAAVPHRCRTQVHCSRTTVLPGPLCPPVLPSAVPCCCSPAPRLPCAELLGLDCALFSAQRSASAALALSPAELLCPAAPPSTCRAQNCRGAHCRRAVRPCRAAVVLRCLPDKALVELLTDSLSPSSMYMYLIQAPKCVEAGANPYPFYINGAYTSKCRAS